LIILQSINTHATDWLSRWIWSLSMVHHRTASKKIFLHVQRKYIRVSCNLSIRSKSDLRTFDNRYLIINFLQVLLPKITLRIQAVSRHKRDSSDGKKRLKICFSITLYVHMYVYNIIPDNTSVETWLRDCQIWLTMPSNLFLQLMKWFSCWISNDRINWNRCLTSVYCD
jgi:hypothetical protein